MASELIWEGADLSIGAMTFINIAVLIRLNREVKEETELYFGRENRKKRRGKRLKDIE